MKKSLRKRKSCQGRRDIWDNSKIYLFYELSTARIKYKLEHLPKKDARMRKALMNILELRKHV